MIERITIEPTIPSAENDAGDTEAVTELKKCDIPEPDGNGKVLQPASPATDDQTLAEIRAGIEFLAQSATSQGEQIDALVQRDALLERVHTRLAAYEQDEHLRKFVEPLTRKVASLHRGVIEHLALLTKAIDNTPEPLQRHTTHFWAQRALEGIRVELENLVGDFGVEPFTVESNRFDRSRQEAVRRIATCDEQQNGLIAERLAPGFQLGDRVIVAERVTVYVLSKRTRTCSPSKKGT